MRNALNFVYDAITELTITSGVNRFCQIILKFLTTFCTEMELMGFATIDNSKSVRSTNLIFAHKTDIGATFEKMQKNKISKILELMGFAK